MTTDEATKNTRTVRGNVIEAGDIELAEPMQRNDGRGRPIIRSVERCLVIQFATEAECAQALRDRRVTFTFVTTPSRKRDGFSEQAGQPQP